MRYAKGMVLAVIIAGCGPGSPVQRGTDWDRFVADVTMRLQQDAARTSQKPGVRRRWAVTSSERLNPTSSRLVAVDETTIGSNTRQVIWDLDYSLQAGKWKIVSGTKKIANSANDFREDQVIDTAVLYENEYVTALFADH